MAFVSLCMEDNDDIPVTAQVIGGLDNLIYAVFTYARREGVDAYAIRGGLGLGLLVSSNSDSMRIGSCAQLLGAGQRIRKWCAGGWLDNVNDCFLGKPKEPEGKKKFGELVSALDTPGEEAQSEWARAVLAATRDHLAISRRDLTSKEVYEIIFEKTRPGALVGDEASGEGTNVRPRAGYGCVAWLNLLEGLGLSHGGRWASGSTSDSKVVRRDRVGGTTGLLRQLAREAQDFHELLAAVDA
ncbi:hypothetical protein FA13DRAFT_1720240 [Coprinellus micaceus]|uniref:Uncharacterized protein n=1 Tax=Coprinellus micaceus TaxID=71717 RepID=A0A4Y7S9R5_COPMI|nr:hypothetical protein FA13DRAFT_1720240 [Coprinellus micaceus]